MKTGLKGLGKGPDLPAEVAALKQDNFGDVKVLTYTRGNFKKSAFVVDTDHPDKVIKIDHESFDHASAHTLVVKNKLYAVTDAPVRVFKYTYPQEPALTRKTELQPLPQGEGLGSFSVTSMENSRIILTGGYKSGTFQSKVYVFDLETERWLEQEPLPDLREARWWHSSCSVGKVIYVYGGVGDGGYLSTAEVLDTEAGATEWTSFHIDGLAPRVAPLFAPCQSSNFLLILGSSGNNRMLSDGMVVERKGMTCSSILDQSQVEFWAIGN